MAVRPTGCLWVMAGEPVRPLAEGRGGHVELEGGGKRISHYQVHYNYRSPFLVIDVVALRSVKIRRLFI